MPLRQLTRLLVAAIIAAGAAPVFAQVDLAADLSLDGDSSLSTKGVSMGKTETYTLAVTNNGVTPVTEFTITGAFDSKFTPAGGVQPKVTSGCTPVDTTPDPVTGAIDQFPCVWRGILYGTQEADITVDVTYPTPDGYDPATAACPNATADVSGGDVSFTSTMTISNFNGSGTVTNAGNSTGSKTSFLRNLADLEVVSVTSDAGGGGMNQNAEYTYTTVVKNNGPCAAPAVRVAFGGATSFSYVDTSVSANCASDTSMVDFNRCSVGALAKGAEATVTSRWALGSYPKETTQAAATMEVTATSRSSATLANADDPVGDNSANAASNSVNGLSSSGCSTGGAGGILGGLLAIAALRLGRRRQA